MKKQNTIEKAVPNPEPIPNGWPAPMNDPARYGIAGEFLEAVGPYTEADPQALLTQIHAGYGNLVGNKPHLMVENTRHGANLFLGVAGASAKARKGTSWDHCANVLNRVDEVWARERVESGLASGEGLIALVRDSTPSDPGVEDKRLFIFEGDFSRIQKAMSRTGNTLSPILRKSWDGGDLRVATKNSPLRATLPHISLVVQSTGYELIGNFDAADMLGGSGNRFMWICARRSKLLPLGGRLPAAVIREIEDRLRTSANFASQVGQVRLTAKARKLWCAEYPTLSAASPGLLGAMTSRAEPQVLRLALISALMNRCDEIRTQHLEAALAIWEYSLASAKFLFGGKSVIKLDDKLLRKLRESQEGLTQTQISEALNHHVSGDEIASALERLNGKGLAKSKEKKTTGRSAKLWLATSKEETKPSRRGAA